MSPTCPGSAGQPRNAPTVTAATATLDFTERVPLVLTTLERLQQHGPYGPAWWRVAQHLTGFEPLLQALTDAHTPAAYRERQEQRDAERWQRGEVERAAANAAMQRMWDDDPDDDEDELEEALCATPDCGWPLSVLPTMDDEATAPVPIPPEDGAYCWVCRLSRDYWEKPGLRGALRRMWNAPSYPPFIRHSRWRLTSSGRPLACRPCRPDGHHRPYRSPRCRGPARRTR
ncbi:hypothetical protein SCOCK_140065 [Actinacidiphila cocklensis]|uniref:Uncharacterized protein n=1 Tax=Actinacidiphila cocklensis TaxID=887465 RepID=A0A9W4DKK0_9ACTN|nr:hypothetical protein SCOCK_140065 [Actinacidiphila cocklensis]